MAECETCGAAFVLGTLFCMECGAPLFRTNPKEAANPQQYAHFLILENGRKQRVPLSEAEPILIGRADPDADHWPQLDFSDDGGLEKGVSRQHAILRAANGQVQLIDCGSANGSWIDNVRLEPDKAYPLPFSSRVRFGKIDVHIVLE
jgi:pSer/pThr/pTyr-binding forkhead associated (FHA) protein